MAAVRLSLRDVAGEWNFQVQILSCLPSLRQPTESLKLGEAEATPAPAEAAPDPMDMEQRDPGVSDEDWQEQKCPARVYQAHLPIR